MNAFMVAKLSAPATGDYIYAYGVGYYYGRVFGDEEAGRIEIQRYIDRPVVDEAMAIEGFKMGYSDGVEDYCIMEGDE